MAEAFTPPPSNYWTAAKRDKLLEPILAALRDWRNEDHGETIILDRGDVCLLLDEIERLERQNG